MADETVKRAEAAAALGDTEAAFRMLADAPFPAALWSGSDLRFRWMNRACAEVVHGDPDGWDVLGMPYSGFLSEASCASRFIDVAYTGQPYSDPAYEQDSDGHTRVWQLSYLPVAGRVEDPYDVLLTAVEVTDRAEAERAERRRRDDLASAVGLINTTILSSLDAEEILERVLTEATEAFGADWGWLAERAGSAWTFRNVHGWPKDIVGLSFREDELSLPGLAAGRGTILYASAGRCPSEYRELMERHDIGGFVLVPIRNRGEITAVLGFCWDGAFVFSDGARVLAENLAVSLSLALENARLYDEERTFARSLRSALLPRPVAIEGFELGHLYHAAASASRMGGTFYDVVSLADGRAGVLMGVVQGTGVEMAALTSSVRTAMRSAVHRLPAPANVLARTNEFARNATDRGVAAAAFMGLVGPDGRMQYSLAAHPSPMVLRADGELDLLRGDTFPLGARAEAAFAVHETVLGEGDLMLLYTESLTRARDRSGHRYGVERLGDALRGCSDVPAREVPESLFMSAFSFADGVLDEEIAVMALRREPARGFTEEARLLAATA